MAEGTLTETIRKIVAKAEPYIPQVPKPKKENSFTTENPMDFRLFSNLPCNGSNSFVWRNCT